MTFGYARISTGEQSLDSQFNELINAGVDPDNIFSDTSSGKKMEREGLDKLLKVLRKGDVLVVYRLDRIARSVLHLTKLMDDFQKKGIDFRSIQEPFIDTTSSNGKFLLTIIGAFAQLERDVIIERTMSGLKAARLKGKVGGRKKGLSNPYKLIAMDVYNDYQNGTSIREIMANYQIGSISTVYKCLDYINNNKINLKNG